MVTADTKRAVKFLRRATVLTGMPIPDDFVETDASAEGRQAFKDGVPVDANPYRGLRGMEWMMSWYWTRDNIPLVGVTIKPQTPPEMVDEKLAGVAQEQRPQT